MVRPRPARPRHALWDFGARGTLLGITRGTGRPQIVRAVLEGVAHRGADLVEAAETDAGRRIPTLRVDGGMSANPTFVQAVADATQRPVEVAPVTEATTLGAAFLAGLAVGTWSGFDDIAAAWRPRTPSSRRHRSTATGGSSPSTAPRPGTPTSAPSTSSCEPLRRPPSQQTFGAVRGVSPSRSLDGSEVLVDGPPDEDPPRQPRRDRPRAQRLWQQRGQDADRGAPATSATPAGGTAASGTTTDCTAHPGKTVTVEIGNFVFNPTPVTVAVCDSVVWKNTHNQAHTSTGNGDKSWNTGNIAPGASAAPIVFDKTGSLAYMCALHPFHARRREGLLTSAVRSIYPNPSPTTGGTGVQTSAKELRQMASDVDDMHHEAMRNFKEEAAELHLDVAKKSRRSFMTKVGAAGVGGALLSTGGASLGFGSLLGTAGAAGLTDTQIAGYAQSVELAAVAAYTAAAPALKGDALAVAQLFLSHHKDHADAFGAVAKGDARPTANPKVVAAVTPTLNAVTAKVKAGKDATTDVLTFAHNLENQAAYTYAAALTLLSSPAYAAGRPPSCRSRPSTPPCWPSSSAWARRTCSPPVRSSPPPSATARTSRPASTPPSSPEPDATHTRGTTQDHG